MDFLKGVLNTAHVVIDMFQVWADFHITSGYYVHWLIQSESFHNHGYPQVIHL